MSLHCTLSRASPNLCDPTFQPVLQQGLVLHFPGVEFPPVLGIQMLVLIKPVQAAVGRKSETLWITGIQPFLGGFPKILPSCWPEQQSESWGKGGDTWHPSKTFRSGVTEGSCPSPPVCGEAQGWGSCVLQHPCILLPPPSRN